MRAPVARQLSRFGEMLSRRAALSLLRRSGCGALALDVSATKVGIAVSDPERACALPLVTLRRGRLDASGAATRARPASVPRRERRPRPRRERRRAYLSIRNAGVVADALRPLLADHGVGLLVVGWPLELSGAEGKRCREIRAFVADLAEYGRLALPTTLVDERFTTRSARVALAEAGASEKWIDKAEDAVSAALVLDDLLGGLPEKEAPPTRPDFFGDG